jgi:hypothetical protein
MPITMSDLMSHPAYQAALQDSFTRQRAKNLAVAPRVDLSDVIRRDATLEQATGTLGLQQQRLALAKDAYAREQGGLSWTLGIGAVGLGANLYGAYKGYKADERSEQQATQLQQAYTTMGTQGAANTAALKEAYGGIAQVAKQYQDYLNTLKQKYPMTNPTPAVVDETPR